MIISEEDLISGIRFGLGSQGIWTPELEEILLDEITRLSKPEIVFNTCIGGTKDGFSGICSSCGNFH